MKAMYFLQKKSILLICFSLLMVSVYAGPVGKEKAQRVAQNFLNREVKMNSGNFVAAYEAVMDVNKSQTVMHVFSSDHSYIVVSADDRVYPILAYSNESSFPEKGKVPPFDFWMDQLSSGIVAQSRLKSTVAEDVAAAWELYDSNLKSGSTLKSTNSVAPLLSTFWNQDNRYNYYCPTAPSGPDGKCYAGCVAASMAQVMRFYNYPETGRGTYAYEHPAYGLLSADFGNTTYDWANMVTDLTQIIITDTVSRNAIAKLMYHCGVAVNMDYAPSGSGSQTDYVPEAMYNYFKYRRQINTANRINYTDDEWRNLLVENLDMSYPMIYRGNPPTGGVGHAWVLDGYQSTNFFHFNFGWGGYANGNFLLNNLTPPGNNFNGNQGIVYNIVPDNTTLYPYCDSKKYFAKSYTFTDGSYTDKYLNNTNCEWLIKPDTMPNQSLTLSFIEFRTEAGKDILTVYDGENSSGTILGSYSGNTLPATLTSTTGAFFLVFVTDGANNDFGWKVKYTSQFLGVQENEVAAQLNVYPNPAHNQLNISGDFKVSGNVKYSVANIVGATVLSSEMNIAEGIQNKTIDISQLKAGIYILNIENEKGNAYTKFIVE